MFGRAFRKSVKAHWGRVAALAEKGFEKTRRDGDAGAGGTNLPASLPNRPFVAFSPLRKDE